jgi:ABC-type antimicrobial peptide transport system permease subunit
MARYTARAFCAIVRLRNHADARTQVGSLRAELERAGPTRTLNVATFQDHLSRALAADRLTAGLIAAGGLVALALAVVGVYGVMADMVRRRTREIGLRMALGAGPLHIAKGIVGACATPALGGIAAGLGAAVLLARIARMFVFEVPPADLWTLVLTTGGLALVLAAAIAPSTLRALHVSPLTALRNL